MKRTLRLFLLLIFILVIIGLIWYWLPVSRIQPSRFSDKDAMINASVQCEGQPILLGLENAMVEQKISKDISSKWKLRLIRTFLPLFLPVNYRLLAYPEPSPQNPTYMMVVDFGKRTKLIRYLHNQLNNRIFQGAEITVSDMGKYQLVKRNKPVIPMTKSPNACAWMESGLVLSNDAAVLQKQMDIYLSSNNPAKISDSPISITIDNKSSFLTDKIRVYEKKFDFEIFSSIDSVRSVDMHLTPTAVDELSGTIVFHGYNQLSDSDIMLSDVNFFYGVLRRKLRPEGIELQGDVSYHEKDAELKIKVNGFAQAITLLGEE